MPNNWKTYKLSEITEYIGRGISPKYTEEDSIRVINQRCIRGNKIIFETCRNHDINKKGVSAVKFVKQYDVLVNSTGVGTLGRVAQFKVSLDKITVDSHVSIVRPKAEFADEFFGYAVINNQPKIESLGIGSTGQTELSRTRLGEEIEVNIPNSKDERLEIANILSAIDDKIENNLATNKTLEDMAMALYKHWFVDFGPFQDGEFVDSELGLIPKSWEVKSIGDVIETLGGGTPKTSESSYWENGDILWYSPTDLTRDNAMFSLDSSKKINELGLSKSSAKLFPPYSLLMSSRATIGALTINTIQASTNQGFITMIPNDKISISQLYSWTKDNLDLIISKANGSTFKEISKTNFRNLDIVIGKDIEPFLRDSKDIFDKVENNIIENESLTKLRDTLLPKLISGEIRLKEFR